MNSIKNIVCGVSGGVDSAVSALILKRKGFNVHGVFMRNWDLTNETGCTIEADREDAAYVCQELDIPFREVSFVKEYWTEVFCDMLEEYESGLTPNPDILCNQRIKFGYFFDHVMTTLGADAVATGHYARNSWGQFLEHSGKENGAKLLRSVDQRKDQTLFLSQIHQRALQKTMFPIGNIRKNVVKSMAMDAGLERIVKKKESTGICFIGKREFQDFIEEYIEPNPGNFVDLDTGQIVGQHQGFHNWTIGQRTCIGGLNAAYFVAIKCNNSTDIMVVKGTRHPALYTQDMVGVSPHWIHSVPEELLTTGTMLCQFRYQHVHPLTPCSVTLNDKQELEIRVDKPLRAIAIGQYAVLYKDQECLGSAKILQTGPSLYELDIHKPKQQKKGIS